METNECLENNGGCWKEKSSNITACKVLGLPNLVRHIIVKKKTVLHFWLFWFWLYACVFPNYRTLSEEEYVYALL